MNDDESLLAESLEKVLADHVDAALRERAEAGHFPLALWQQLADLGLPLAAAPASAGGSELPLAVALTMVGVAARHATPLPLAETLIASSLIGDRAGRLAATPMALAVAESFAVRDGRLDAEASAVRWGQAAGCVLVVGPDDAVALADPAHARAESTSNVAGEPVARLSWRRAPAHVINIPDAAVRCAGLQALASALAMAGAMQTVLAMTLEHARTRSQFGRPIAGFQAIQHLLAEMAGEVATALRAADAARRSLGSARFDLEVAAAKARGGEAAGRVAAIAHQVHGAIGFAREHALQQFTRRLWAWRDEHGNEAHWQRHLGFVLARHGDAWRFLVD